MTQDEFNAFCSELPCTNHVVQWGGADVWKVDSKVFSIGGWNSTTNTLGITFKVSPMDYEALADQQGIRPAPYLASRGMKWLQHYDEPGFPDEMLREHITESHRIVSLGLSKKRQRELGLNQAMDES